MCVTEEIKFKAHNACNEVYGNITLPVGEALGILHIVHGMKEHMGRYKEFSSFMAQKGYIVCCCDMAGHGRSVGSGGRYGYFGEKDGHISLVNDVYTLYKLMKNRFSGIPYFILGHSMGSFIARQFYAEYPDAKLDGALFSGTGYMNPLILGAAVKMASILITVYGNGMASIFIDKYITENYNKPFKGEQSSSAWLSRDTEKVKEFDTDTLTNFQFTHAGYRDLFLLLKSVSQKSWAAKINKDVPVYFFSGGNDPVGKYGRGVVKVCGMLSKAGHEKVTLKLYKDGRHEMLNEINRTEVYEDVYNWISGVNKKARICNIRAV